MSRWTRLSQSFWFLPALLCLGAVVLAEGLILLDQRYANADLGALDVLITRVGESGSRDLLGAIAGSMLTVASTTFSITIAVLALSSSTYGPRLVRNFMADRGNQLVLGIFVATFLYSLMVLRSIRVIGEGPGGYFVPHLAVNVAVLLAVLSIGVLVYFIHHISDSVQVWTLADRVRVDLIEVIDRLHPESADGDDLETGAAQDAPGQPDRATPVTSDETGYVQGIDFDSLVDLAHERDLVIWMQVRPGRHVTRGTTLAVVSPPDRLGKEEVQVARQAVQIERARNPQQDVEFPALLLEEMAVRALSPGTNDPYTAINALDNLAGGLVALASRPPPSPYRRDRDGRSRVIAPPVSLLAIVAHLLDAMRLYATEHPPVLHRTLELIAQVGAACPGTMARETLAEHPARLVDAFAATSPEAADLQELAGHASRVRQELLTSHDHM